MFDPETIEVALFNLIQSGVQGLGINTISRKASPPQNVPEANQPALFLVPLGWLTDQMDWALPKFRMRYLVLLYIRADANPDFIPQTLMNQTAAGIITALTQLPPGSKQSLGGLVENAWQDGEVVMQPGILDQQCAMELPITAITAMKVK